MSNLMRAPDDETLPSPPPVLMVGEKTQGFLSAEYLPPRIDERVVCGSFNAIRLKNLL